MPVDSATNTSRTTPGTLYVDEDESRFVRGWHGIEDWPPAVRWTGKKALVRIERPTTAPAHFGLRVSAGPAGACGKVELDGCELCSFELEPNETRVVRAPVPARMLARSAGDVEVVLSVARTFVPARVLPGSSDPRELGLAVECLWLGPQDPIDSPMRYERNQERYRGAANDLPIPPARLNELVSGTRDVSWYVAAGRMGFDAILACLARNGVELAELRKVLDFGCGSGRVIRYWKGRGPQLFGSDYNPELVEWCRGNLAFAEFATNELAPPLVYADATFDLVYSLSVFTHLDEPMQEAWMAELARVLKPGGLAYITTHGDHESYLVTFDERERARFDAGLLVVKEATLEGTNTCMAYHPSDYFRRLARVFELLEHEPRGAKGNPYQDSYLLRKPVSSSSS